MNDAEVQQLQQVNILMADDDIGDLKMAVKSLQQNHLINQINTVHNGVELLDYLNSEGEYSDRTQFPFPDLLLLDLNMPKKNGLESLKEIRESATLKDLPVVMLTTSDDDEDICNSYNLGVNSYITKPVTFQGLNEALMQLSDYWFALVKLPKIYGGH